MDVTKQRQILNLETVIFPQRAVERAKSLRLFCWYYELLLILNYIHMLYNYNYVILLLLLIRCIDIIIDAISYISYMYIYCIYIYVYLYTYIYINTCSPGFLTLSLVVVLMLSLPQSSLSYFLCLSLSLVLSRSLSFPLAVGNTCLQLGWKSSHTTGWHRTPPSATEVLGPIGSTRTWGRQISQIWCQLPTGTEKCAGN